MFDGPADADAAATTFLRAPTPACAAALLVRSPPVDVWSGLGRGVGDVLHVAVRSRVPGLAEAAWHPATGRAPSDRASGSGSGATVQVTEIVLTRPARRNALDVRMRDELHAALTDELGGAGPDRRRGDGSSFSEGGDLDEFGTFPDPVVAHTIRLGRSLAWRFAQLARGSWSGCTAPRSGPASSSRRSPATSSPPTTPAWPCPSWGSV